MKKIVILISALLLSTMTYARQYIQCSSLDPNSFDGMVINLNGEKSTLFMTNGVHLPPGDEIRVLKKLYFSETNETHTIYKTDEAPIIETVTIANENINVYSNFFLVNILMTNLNNGSSVNFDVSCFSSLYND